MPQYTTDEKKKEISLSYEERPRTFVFRYSTRSRQI